MPDARDGVAEARAQLAHKIIGVIADFDAVLPKNKMPMVKAVSELLARHACDGRDGRDADKRRIKNLEDILSRIFQTARTHSNYSAALFCIRQDCQEALKGTGDE